MNSMNKQVQENTIQSQNEWNACLLFRNKQLAQEVLFFCFVFVVFFFVTILFFFFLFSHNSGLRYYKE